MLTETAVAALVIVGLLAISWVMLPDLHEVWGDTDIKWTSFRVIRHYLEMHIRYEGKPQRLAEGLLGLEQDLGPFLCSNAAILLDWLYHREANRAAYGFAVELEDIDTVTDWQNRCEPPLDAMIVEVDDDEA